MVTEPNANPPSPPAAPHKLLQLLHNVQQNKSEQVQTEEVKDEQIKTVECTNTEETITDEEVLPNIPPASQQE